MYTNIEPEVPPSVYTTILLQYFTRAYQYTHFEEGKKVEKD